MYAFYKQMFLDFNKVEGIHEEDPNWVTIIELKKENLITKTAGFLTRLEFLQMKPRLRW